MIIPTDVHRLPLGVVQFLDDLLFVGCHLFGDSGKPSLELGILGLLSQRFCPVHGQVEMAATGVQFFDAARRRTVLLHVLSNRLVQCVGQDLSLVVAEHSAEMLKRSNQSAELTQRIPPQMTFFQELFDVPGG